MSESYVALLGPPVAVVGGSRNVLTLSRPVRLFAYLAYARDWVSRDELAYMFHPDAREGVAKHYVRNLIHRVRALPCGDELETKRDACRLRVDTDVVRFDVAVSRRRWEEAVTVHQGPFLQGLEARDVPGFERWLEQRRFEFDAAWQRACLMHAQELEVAARHDEALEVLERLMQRDAWNEEVLLAYLRNAVPAGRRTRALRLADRFADELRAEFGLEPTQATRRLVDCVRRSEPLPELHVVASSHRDGSGRQRPPAASEDVDLTALLTHPAHRLLTYLDSDSVGQPMLLVARRAPDTESAVGAVLDLVDAMLEAGHHRRAVELLALLTSKHWLRPDLTRRFDQVVHELRPHAPAGILDNLRRG